MKKILKIATINLSFHIASAAVIKTILQKHNISVEETLVPHEEAFDLLAKGDVDMLCSAWLPGSHGIYMGPMQNEVINLCTLYKPYALWGVPDYIPKEDVSTIADLRKPNVAARMNKLIQGIGPGAGISRFSREIVALYQLEESGYHFNNGTLTDCVDHFENLVKQGTWTVVPLWQPQYLHHKYKIRELEEPNGLLRDKDNATLLIRKDSLSKLSLLARQELSHLYLGNEVMTTLDYHIQCEGMEISQATDIALTAGTPAPDPFVRTRPS